MSFQNLVAIAVPIRKKLQLFKREQICAVDVQRLEEAFGLLHREPEFARGRLELAGRDGHAGLGGYKVANCVVMENVSLVYREGLLWRTLCCYEVLRGRVCYGELLLGEAKMAFVDVDRGGSSCMVADDSTLNATDRRSNIHFNTS